MATVPKWGGPQVKAQPLPGVRRNTKAPAVSFGTSMYYASRKLDRAGLEAAKVAGDMIDKNNTRKAREAYAGASAAVRNMRRELKDRRGRSAEGMYDEARKRLDSIRAGVAKGLTHPGAADKFEARWAALQESTLNNIDAYERAELYKADEANSAAIIDGALEDAVGNYNSPGAIQNSWSNIVTELEDAADRNGWDEAVLEQKREEMLSTMHVNIIKRMEADNPGQAKAYYDRYQDQIDSRVRVKIKESVTEKVSSYNAQDAADKIVAAFPNVADQTKALEWARKNFSGKAEKKLVSELKTRYSEIKANAELQRNQNLDNAYNGIIDAKNLTDALKVADSLKDGSDRKAARKLAADMYGPSSEKAKKTPENIRARDNLLKLIDEKDESVASEAKLRMEASKAGLTVQQQEEVVGYQQQGGVAGELTRSKVNSAIKAVAGDKKDVSDYPGLWDSVKESLEPGKPVTEDALIKSVGKQLMGGEVPGTLWDSNKTYYDAVQKGEGDKWLPDVSDTEEEEIVKTLKGMGKKVNEKNIRLYKKHEIMGLPVPSKE